MINWINSMVSTPTTKSAVQNTMPTQSTFLAPIQPLDTKTGQNPQQYNPFMTALKPDSHAYRETYGVNRPLDKPIFVGYHNNKALYAGSKLFILY